jgi:hypothetical protein
MYTYTRIAIKSGDQEREIQKRRYSENICVRVCVCSVLHNIIFYIFILPVSLCPPALFPSFGTSEQPPSRQFMGGVPCPNSRVHIWQTSKLVVVQRCGLTNDRKAAPRPSAPAHHPTKSVHVDFQNAEYACKSAA